MLVGSLSPLPGKLRKKLEGTCVAVKGITGYVGHTGSVLSGVIIYVEREEEEFEFVSCPGMRKAEVLGIGCGTSWRVALPRQPTAVCGCGGQQWDTPQGTEYQLPAGALPCGRRMCVLLDAEETLYFLFRSSALHSPLDSTDRPPIFHRPCNFFMFS